MLEILAIIAPVFMIKLLGFTLGRTKLFPEGASSILITFVWYIAIPALMFRAMASRDLPAAEEMVLLPAYYGAVLFTYFLAVLLGQLIFRMPLGERGVFALSACFANGGFIGIPLIEGAFGKEGLNLLLVILSMHSLVLLTISTIIVEQGSDQNQNISVSRRIITSIGKNPLLIALTSGLLWSAIGLPFPEWLDRMVALPALSAAPVGLFAAGMALSNVKIAGDIRHASLAVALKLLLLPASAFAMTYWVFGLPHLWVSVATVTAALPSGMVAYSFASQYTLAPRRAATTVLLSTVLSFFTLSLLLLLLRSYL